MVSKKSSTKMKSSSKSNTKVKNKLQNKLFKQRINVKNLGKAQKKANLLNKMGAKQAKLELIEEKKKQKAKQMSQPPKNPNDDFFESNYKYQKVNYVKDSLNRTPFQLPIKINGRIAKYHESSHVEDTANDARIEAEKAELMKNKKNDKLYGSQHKDDDDVEMTEEKEGDDEDDASLPEVVRMFARKKKMDTLVEKIAGMSKEIVASPSTEMKKLKELRAMVFIPTVRDSNVLKKLVIVSLSEIFKDIAPGYKIRSWTETEKEQVISDDVKEVRAFEETLIVQYKLFIDYVQDQLKNLDKLFRSSSNVERIADFEAKKSFAFICTRSLCNLIERLSFFNYAANIIDILVGQLNSKIKEVVDLVSACVQKLFRTDKDLTLSLLITEKITKMIKQHSFGVEPRVLNVFLALSLNEQAYNTINEPRKKPMKPQMRKKNLSSRTDKKKIKQKAKLEKDLDEHNKSLTKFAKSKTQARILEQLFLTYFKILKKIPNFKLLPPVLEGLCKFAHLINVDYFEDLITVMESIITSDRLNLKTKLHCVKIVFVILSGQGESLAIDPIRFYKILYGLILDLDATSAEITTLFAQCVNFMILRRLKFVPSHRVLSFLKRCMTATLQVNAKCAGTLLKVLTDLMGACKSAGYLFDIEHHNSGKYMPEVDEPDYANAQNSAIWEVHLLRRHYSFDVREKTNGLLKKEIELN